MIDSVYRFRNEAFILREVENELVLVPLVNNIVDMTDVITLNEVATAILQAIDGKTSNNEIIEIIFQKYEIDKDILTKDIFDFIESAVEKRIIELV